MKFYKIWTIIPSLLGTQLELHFQQNLCNTLTPRRFILMTSCRTETETISRIQKVGPFGKLDHSIVVAAMHQSVTTSSLCLCQGSQHILWFLMV